MRFSLKNKYYHLMASLPVLNWDTPSLIGIDDYFSMVNSELDSHDRDIILYIRYGVDVENIVNKNAFWRKGGLFVKSDIKIEEVKYEQFPIYIQEYLKETNVPEQNTLLIQKKIFEEYYDYGLYHFENKNLFDWIQNERLIRNVIVAFETDSEINMFNKHTLVNGEEFELLKRGKLGVELLRREQTLVKNLLNSLIIQDMIDRQKAIDYIRWNFIEQQMQFEYFSVDVFIEYTLKLFLLNRWQSLDSEKGGVILEKKVDELIDRYLHKYFEQ